MYAEAYETLHHYQRFFYNMRFLVMFMSTVCILFLLKRKWPKNKFLGNFFCVFMDLDSVSGRKHANRKNNRAKFKNGQKGKEISH